MHFSHIRDTLHYILGSITTRLLAVMLLAIIPIFGLMIYNTNLSRRSLLEEVQQVQNDLLSSYCSQLNSQLDAASDFVIDLVYYDNDSKVIHQSKDQAAIQYAALRIQEKMDDILKSTDLITGYFLISQEFDDYWLLLNRCNYRYNALTQTKLLDFFSQQQDDMDLSTSSTWLLQSIDGEDYLFYYSYLNDEQVYGGCYLRVRDFKASLIREASHSDTYGEISILLKQDLDALIDILPAADTVAYASLTPNILLMESYPKELLTGTLPLLQRYALLFITITLVLFLVFVWVLWRLVVHPILILASSMYKVENGDLEHRITTDANSTEFKMLHTVFNHMVDNIQHLTIDVYQEQLKVQQAKLDVQEAAMREQRSQLRNLQLQIKPHFLINSLNMVYNLIETSKLSTAQRLIKYTAEYFRYMTRIDEDLVPLNEEIDHITSYLEIQSLRYQNSFSYQIQVDPMVADMLIPPMTLQNYVENSIKYALHTDTKDASAQPLQLQVTVDSFEKELYPYAVIEIRDSGDGFPEDMLDTLNAGKRIDKKDGSHIGLRNTTQRLSILFNNKARWHYENDGGAVVRLIIPVTFAEEDEEDWEEEL